jgi:hypothetical protein
MTTYRRGYAAILMMLIVVAIGFVIYYLQFAALGGSGPKGYREKPEDQPWAHESSLKDTNSPKAKKPSKKTVVSEVKIANSVTIDAPVTSSGADRGRISITIQKNGDLKGSWKCLYSYTHASYQIESSFAGNTDPTVLDTTPNGKPDTSKLYFIARGTYTQQETNLDSAQRTTTKGIVYVNGYLDADKNASGKISLTINKNSHVDYIFGTPAK